LPVSTARAAVWRRKTTHALRATPPKAYRSLVPRGAHEDSKCRRQARLAIGVGAAAALPGQKAAGFAISVAAKASSTAADSIFGRPSAGRVGGWRSRREARHAPRPRAIARPSPHSAAGLAGHGDEAEMRTERHWRARRGRSPPRACLFGGGQAHARPTIRRRRSPGRRNPARSSPRALDLRRTLSMSAASMPRRSVRFLAAGGAGAFLGRGALEDHSKPTAIIAPTRDDHITHVVERSPGRGRGRRSGSVHRRPSNGPAQIPLRAT